MKIPRTAYALVIALAFLLVASPPLSSGEKKDDEPEAGFTELKRITAAMIMTMSRYALSLEKAENGEEIARAIDQWGIGMEQYTMACESLLKKHPALKNVRDLPEKSRTDYKKWENETSLKMKSIQEKLYTLSAKMEKYEKDTAVIQAMERMKKRKIGWKKPE